MFNFELYKNNTACINSIGRQVKYGELGILAKRIAEHIEPHQLVFCLCSNTIGSIVGYVAFVNNNDASLLLDAHTTKESFDSVIEVYRPRYIWAPVDFPFVNKTNKLFEVEGYQLLDIGFVGTPVANNLSVMLATSGSTGSPKFVRLSKENLHTNALSIIEYLHITDKEKPILALPMNYAYGLSIINSHLLSGATLLLTEVSFIEREFWQFANKNKATSYSGVPYSYEIIKKLGIWKQDIPTLRTLTQSGGILSKELVSFFNETFSPKGVKFYLMYGQAEATARISYLEPDRIKEKLGSIGKAIPGGKMSLIDENGKKILTPNTIGEIVYEGPNVSLGYAVCAEDLTKDDENHGLIHTGDMAYYDTDGFYYIAGRKSRFVKLFGHRISIDHIEGLVQTQLNECACIGDDNGITIYTTNKNFDKDKVINLIASRTKLPKKVFCVRYINKIPRSEAGKVLYKKLSIR